MTYAPSHRGANMYARVGIETTAQTATPHQLITMLFDGAASSIAMARHHMAENNIKAKGQAISRAIDIVDNGLKASLDPVAAGADGEALVSNLEALYIYVVRRLMQANLHNDPAGLDEAARLLGDVASAWREIDPANQPLAAAA